MMTNKKHIIQLYGEHKKEYTSNERNNKINTDMIEVPQDKFEKKHNLISKINIDLDWKDIKAIFAYIHCPKNEEPTYGRMLPKKNEYYLKKPGTNTGLRMIFNNKKIIAMRITSIDDEMIKKYKMWGLEVKWPTLTKKQALEIITAYSKRLSTILKNIQIDWEFLFK